MSALMHRLEADARDAAVRMQVLRRRAYPNELFSSTAAPAASRLCKLGITIPERSWSVSEGAP
jgi:hypothetical protein